MGERDCKTQEDIIERLFLLFFLKEAAGHRKRLQDTETKKEIQRMQGTASEVRNMYFKIRDTKKEKEKH